MPASLYSPDAFEVPHGYCAALSLLQASRPKAMAIRYRSLCQRTQSQNLRVIESALDPAYRAKNDTVEFNADYTLTPALTFTSQTGFNHDFLCSTEDYNRFNTGLFEYSGGSVDIRITVMQSGSQITGTTVLFCDPRMRVFLRSQVGCSGPAGRRRSIGRTCLAVESGISLASNFSGPFNFSAGGNYLHYETQEKYYVFINTLTLSSYR